jgi:zinc transport system substrate-binding protein
MICRQIGKDKVNVLLLLPPGVEAHTFEPKPQDMSRINKAGVFIYTGKYMEPWAEDMLKGVSNKNLVVVDSSAGIDLVDEDDHDEEEGHGGEEAHGGDGGHEHEERGHHHGGKDPHIWLDLGNAGIMVDNIAAAFAEKDPPTKIFIWQMPGNTSLNSMARPPFLGRRSLPPNIRR